LANYRHTNREIAFPMPITIPGRDVLERISVEYQRDENCEDGKKSLN
jgi:hypothetical protein